MPFFALLVHNDSCFAILQMGIRYFLIYREGNRRMPKISVDWNRTKKPQDLTPRLSEFRRYLETLGLKKNTVILYTRLINIYLLELNSDMPSSKDAEQFYKSLYDKKLSRSAINNFVAAILKYHAMINKPAKLKFIKLNNALPYYFDQSDILNIFNKCNNIKHYAMLKVLFFGCLRILYLSFYHLFWFGIISLRIVLTCRS